MSYDATKVAFIDTETTGLDPDRDRIWQVAVIIFGDDECDAPGHCGDGKPDGCPMCEGTGTVQRWQEHEWQVKLPERWDNDAHKMSPTGWASEWVKANTRLLRDYNHDTAWDEVETAARLVHLTSGRHIIGAVPSFDDRRLHHLLRRVDSTRWATSTPWHYHTIDVETLMVGFGCGVGAMGGKGWIGTQPWSNLPWSSTELSKWCDVDPAQFGPAHDALNDARWAKACWEQVMGPRHATETEGW